MKKAALWVSRHKPTDGQKYAIAAMGYEIVAMENGRGLGAMPDNGDVRAVLDVILEMANEKGAETVLTCSPSQCEFCAAKHRRKSRADRLKKGKR